MAIRNRGRCDRLADTARQHGLRIIVGKYWPSKAPALPPVADPCIYVADRCPACTSRSVRIRYGYQTCSPNGFATCHSCGCHWCVVPTPKFPFAERGP
jgi:hypothetical protein